MELKKSVQSNRPYEATLHKDKLLNEDKPLHTNAFFPWTKKQFFSSSYVDVERHLQRNKTDSMHVNWSEHEP